MDDYKEQTIASYNQNSQRFAKKFSRLTDANEREEFAEFIELLAGTRVLDLGCGAGEHAQYFASHGLDVTCVDLSEEMINICKKRGLDARQMDIEDLDFPDASFDGIWAVTSLLHIPKKRIGRVVEQLHRIMRADAVLYVCVKQGEGERFVKDADAETKRYFVFYEPEELRSHFSEFFEVIETRKTALGSTTFLQVFFRRK